MLDCCEPLDKVKQDGITFPKVVCLAECAGAFVKAFHSDESSLEAFRDIVRECTSLDDQHVIVSYDRRTFGQVCVWRRADDVLVSFY
jgi:glutathione gamma-glutamylcysteinyltransferase